MTTATERLPLSYHTPVQPAAPPPAPRLASLDVFRGVTIAGMILVNNPGDWGKIYAPLKHAAWHGWTPTDLIFPFFLFIVGVATPFSLAKRRQAGAGSIVARIAIRSAILFALGMFLSGIPTGWGSGALSPSTWRIPGVLQRIAACYFVAALFVAFTTWRVQAIVAVVLIVGYACLLNLAPVPGHGVPSVSKEFNLPGYVDGKIFGDHCYKRPPRDPTYFDPEGLLSTFPAIATTLLGGLAGHWLRTSRGAFEKAAGLFAAGVVGAVVGWVMDRAVVPINKELWTSSFVVFTAGMALLGLGLCYWIIDVHGRWRWALPFTVFGLNPITAFVLAGVLGRLMLLIKWTPEGVEKPVALKTYLYQTFYAPLASPINASLLWAITYVLVFLVLMWVLYAKRIFIKV